MLLNIVSIGLGGLIGVFMRYGIIAVLSNTHFTVRTLLSNTVGCLILGAVVAALNHVELPDHVRLGLIVGCCGALTTFSTLIYDIVTLVSQEQFTQAIYYFLLTNISGVAVFGFGFGLASFLYKHF